jgi:ribonuclease-3
MPLKDRKTLEQTTGISIRNPVFFEEAFTHSSALNELRDPHKTHNERLEFLGDAVLELAVSEHLFSLYPVATEGDLTKLRANIVCEPTLAKLSEQLGFGELAVLGRGEERSGGRRRPALLADLFESFVGALYLDGGFAAVRHFLQIHLFSPLLTEQFPSVFDYKSTLQEIVQHRLLGALVYQIVEERGPSHDREFESHVTINGILFGRGSGRSKKEAEQAAACQALQKMNNEGKK